MNNNIEVKKLNDYFIRYFFGLKGDEDLLLSFINAVMIDSNFATFVSVEIINPSPKAGFSLIRNDEKIENKNCEASDNFSWQILKAKQFL